MAPSLGDLLKSKKDRDRRIEEKLKVGNVFRMNLSREEGVMPKNKGDNGRNKFFVVIGFDAEGVIGALLVNSTINVNLPQQLQDLHYPIKKSDYHFLSHNSHVDCSSIKTISREKFNSDFNWHNSYEPIKEKDLELIIGAVKESPTIKPKTLKRFGLIDPKPQ